MNDTQVVYKVVTLPAVVACPSNVRIADQRAWLANPFLVSAIVRGKAEVKYRPDEWAMAPDWLRATGFHLTAFRSMEGVRSFLTQYQLMNLPCLVFEAEAEDLMAVLPPPLYALDLAEGRMIQAASWGWPEETVMAHRLCLVRCIRSAVDVPELGIEQTV